MKKFYFLMIFLCLFIISITSNYAQEKLNPKGLLKMSLEDLMNVRVVTASKYSQKIQEAPAIISVITAKQIKERGYQNVAEAIGSIPGIDIINDHLQYNLGIRGVNEGMRAYSRIVKIMIDNVPISFRSSSENFLGDELIPINAIKRIEIVKGPSSALYGANAFLGVINIITKDLNRKGHTGIAFSYKTADNLSGYKTEIFTSKKINKLKFYAAVSFSNYNRSGLSPTNIPTKSIYSANDKSQNDIARPVSLFSKLNYSDKKLGNLNLLFSYQLLDKHGAFQDWGTLTNRNRISIKNMSFALNYDKKISESLESKIYLGYANGKPAKNNRLEIDDNSSDWIIRDVGYNGYDISAEMKYDFGVKNNLIFGYDITIDDQNLQTFYTEGVNIPLQANQGIEYGDTTFINSGIYILASFNPAEKLVLYGGLRLDLHNIYEDVLNYRFGATYFINDKFYTKLLLGSSFKAPSATQLYTNYIVPGGVIGNSNLRPERANTIDLLLGGKLTNNFKYTVDGFYTIITNKVGLVLPNGLVSNIKPENLSEIHSAGIEVELNHYYRNFMSFINFSYERSIVKSKNLILRDIKQKTELYPGITIKFGTDYKIPSAFLNIYFEGKYTGSRIASQPNSFVFDPVDFRVRRYELNPYFTFDIYLSTYNFKLFNNKTTTFGLKINNLFNADYSFPGFKNYDIPAFRRIFVININQEI